MNYVKKEIGAYNLHIIKTNLYKTITVKIFFREKAEKENEPYEEYNKESRAYWINQGIISLAKKLLEDK